MPEIDGRSLLNHPHGSSACVASWAMTSASSPGRLRDRYARRCAVGPPRKSEIARDCTTTLSSDGTRPLSLHLRVHPIIRARRLAEPRARPWHFGINLQKDFA